MGAQPPFSDKRLSSSFLRELLGCTYTANIAITYLLRDVKGIVSNLIALHREAGGTTTIGPDAIENFVNFAP